MCNQKTDPTSSIDSPVTSIAIVGIGCHYPGAANPKQLWENVLARRQEFRRFLDQRLPIADYHDPDPDARDKIYSKRAAYIDGFVFDWANRRIPKSAFESTDIVQWWALEVASSALEDAGYSRDSVPPDRTGVVVGNSLTGEQTRATNMRLRWPFVRRVFDTAWRAKGLPISLQEDLASTMEELYKSVFPEVTEDTLAGGLSNTIAGRIANYFDLHGGGYVVDGACASSLLSVSTAADQLINNNWDVAIAGGVDVSLDTFELVGFSKATALTKDEMNVYDKRGAGFIPGEGCGFVVLKRLEDARAAGDTIYALLRGWGVSSDGKGGITAPSSRGQAMALLRAYEKAGYSPHDLDFIEGHGTGTSVGDRAELQGIARAMKDHGEPRERSCGMTSFKSIVGHTKAAAGIGAFIKATAAVNRRVLPPTAGCRDPNPVFNDDARALYPILQGEVLPASRTVRAGVSSMGFGGINTHVTLESADEPSPKLASEHEERALLVSNQDSEILVLGAHSPAELRRQLRELADTVEPLSIGDLSDLAAHLGRRLALEENPHVRAAIVISRPDRAVEQLRWLVARLDEKELADGSLLVNPQKDAWVGHNVQKRRVGFLLPGQGSQQLSMGRVLVERFSWARELVERVDTYTSDELGRGISPLVYPQLDRTTSAQRAELDKALTHTEVAQPAICLASVLYASYLERLGIRPTIVGGHSLGELTAFHLAGAFDEEALFRFAARRGQAMGSAPDEAGAMASLTCSPEQAEALTERVKGYVVVANINSPRQIVISGEEAAVSEALTLAANEGIEHHVLRVFTAFHSRLVEGAAESLRQSSPLPKLLAEVATPVISSVDGEPVFPGLDIQEHFATQFLRQVQFVKLVERLHKQCDLIIEVGPGRVLSGLAESTLEPHEGTCLPVASRPGTARDLNIVLAKAFVHGIDCNWDALYSGRLIRPFVSASERIFIDNPCEREFGPVAHTASSGIQVPLAEPDALTSRLLEAADFNADTLQAYLARRQGFLADLIRSDLHWSAEAGTAPASSDSLSRAPIHQGTAATANLATESASAAEAPQSVDLEATIVELAAQRTGFPPETIALDARMLDDLNLDSIKAGELVAAVAKKAGVAGKLDPAGFASATLAEVAEGIRVAAGETGPTPTTPEGTKSASEPAQDAASSALAVEELLVDAVVQRTGFPAESISVDMRFLDDLNLDSIKAGEVIASVARQTGVAGKVEPSQLAGATLAEAAEAIRNAQDVGQVPAATATAEATESLAPVTQAKPGPTSGTAPAATQPSDQVDNWVRNFVIRYLPEAAANVAPGERAWAGQSVLILAETAHARIAAALRDELAAQGTEVTSASFENMTQPTAGNQGRFSHVIGVLPEAASTVSDSRQKALGVLRRLHTVVQSAAAFHCAAVAFVQFGGGHFGIGREVCDLEVCGTASFARSVHLDHPSLRIRVLDLASSIEARSAAKLIVQELTGAEPFVAVGYESETVRLVPRAEPQEPVLYRERQLDWSPNDVVLVTGGAKGITAECALALARITKARFALIGSSPAPSRADQSGSEIARTLARFAAEGLLCRYYACDLTDSAATHSLVARVSAELGPIQAVVHGAGMNKPRRVEQVPLEDALHEVSPKLLGALHLCQALEKAPPKLFAGFTSIIGVAGMAGNAWYALSNELLDLRLRKFAAAHSNTSVISIAYSVWGEAGMGVRLGVIERLAKVGVGAIPTAEGVGRFLDLIQRDPGDQQVVVTASLAGLDTWALLTKPSVAPTKPRFVDQILQMEPGVELVTRTHLSPDRDRYLKDHDYRGSLLFPTVFGLEAMTQAALYLTGAKAESVVRLEDISLRRPIVVDPSEGVAIELRAVAQEMSADHERRVRVAIRTEQTGYQSEHFSATLVFGVRRDLSGERPQLEKPLALDPQTDLYGGLLFQGPLFRRMREVYCLDDKHVVFRAQAQSVFADGEDGFAPGQGSPFMLGDPFLRDVFLQSVQLALAPDIVLPVEIARIERFSAANRMEGSYVVTALINGREDQEIGTDVLVTDAQGTIFERLSGYRVRILERHPDQPTATQLANLSGLGAWDQEQLDEAVGKKLEELGYTPPTMLIDYLPGLHGITGEERHEREMPLINRAAMQQLRRQPEAPSNFAVQWLSSGKPRLVGGVAEDLDLSLSHDDHYCLCVVGEGVQGCDLAPVNPLPEADWLDLLGSHREALLKTLMNRGESIGVAATRIWAAVEAVRKASSTHTDIGLSLMKADRKAVLLEAQLPTGSFSVLTTTVTLSREPPRIVAIVILEQEETTSTIPAALATGHPDRFYSQQQAARFIYDKQRSQNVYEHLFQPAFKDCGNLSRGVFFSSYLLSIGQVRELFMAEIAPQLVAQISSGEWGLVTNWAELSVSGNANAYDSILARFRLGEVKDSVIPLRCDFYKVMPGRHLELIAHVDQETTWVRVIGHGRVRPEPLPPYFAKFVEKTRAHNGEAVARLEIADARLGLDWGAMRYSAPQSPNGLPVIASEAFSTTLEDSNLVGNVYYANYFIWQGRVRDRYFHTIVPDLMQGIGQDGEPFCLRSRLDYLRDAMPFDRVEVDMSLLTAWDHGVHLRFTYYRQLLDGRREKLAVGEHELVWVKGLATGKLTPVRLPQSLSTALIKAGAVSLHQGAA